MKLALRTMTFCRTTYAFPVWEDALKSTKDYESRLENLAQWVLVRSVFRIKHRPHWCWQVLCKYILPELSSLFILCLATKADYGWNLGETTNFLPHFLVRISLNLNFGAKIQGTECSAYVELGINQRFKRFIRISQQSDLHPVITTKETGHPKRQCNLLKMLANKFSSDSNNWKSDISSLNT